MRDRETRAGGGGNPEAERLVRSLGTFARVISAE